jgi:hypothetical protein
LIGNSSPRGWWLTHIAGWRSPGSVSAIPASTAITDQLSRLQDVNQRLLWMAMAAVVIVIWLVGAAVTRFSLEQMAYFAPLAVVVVGATIGIVLLWVKIVRDSFQRRRSAP